MFKKISFYNVARKMFISLYIFLTVSIIFFLLLFGNPQSSVMGYSFMRVITGSMEPAIISESLIIIRNTDPLELEIGDIVTFARGNNTTITHRIYEIIPNYNDGVSGFRLIGDAVGIPDPGIIEGQNTIGRVIFVSYPLGQALALFQEYFWYVVIFVIVLLILSIIMRKK